MAFHDAVRAEQMVLICPSAADAALATRPIPAPTDAAEARFSLHRSTNLSQNKLMETGITSARSYQVIQTG